VLAYIVVPILIGESQQQSLGLVRNFFLSVARNADMHFSTPNSPTLFVPEKDATGGWQRTTECSVPFAIFKVTIVANTRLLFLTPAAERIGSEKRKRS